jgi:hypothetical protein
MQADSFARSFRVNDAIVDGRAPIGLILIGILGLIEAGCGPPR